MTPDRAFVCYFVAWIAAACVVSWGATQITSPVVRGLLRVTAGSSSLWIWFAGFVLIGDDPGMRTVREAWGYAGGLSHMLFLAPVFISIAVAWGFHALSR